MKFPKKDTALAYKLLDSIEKRDTSKGDNIGLSCSTIRRILLKQENEKKELIKTLKSALHMIDEITQDTLTEDLLDEWGETIVAINNSIGGANNA